MTAFLRDGKLAPGLLKGIDIKKLNGNEKSDLLSAMNKSETGTKLSQKDIQAVMLAHKKGS